MSEEIRVSAGLSYDAIVRQLVDMSVPRELAERTASEYARQPAPPANPTLKAIAAAARKAKTDTQATKFRLLCKHHGLPFPAREVRFHPTRKWRFDWAWEDEKIALEVDGGAFIPGGGRHNRGAGFIEDNKKLSAAAALGWRVIRVTPSTLCTDTTIRLVREAMDQGER